MVPKLLREVSFSLHCTFIVVMLLLTNLTKAFDVGIQFSCGKKSKYLELVYLFNELCYLKQLTVTTGNWI
jgi:hypothetical protein